MKKGIRSLLFMLLITLMIAMAGCKPTYKGPRVSGAVTLTISAAASLTKPMGEIKTLYKKMNPNVTIKYNFGASGALQQQIEKGDNIDLFFSAATKQMDILQKKGLIIDSTKIKLLGNSVVLIVKSDSISSISDFKSLRNDTINKVALGDPKTVPVGQYAEEIFTSLNMLDKIKTKAVYGKDVMEVLSWVETGKVDAGVVYDTDAKTSEKVKVVSVAEKNLYKTPVVYPAAIIKSSKNIDDTSSFLNFLCSDKAKEVFEKYGFNFLLK